MADADERFRTVVATLAALSGAVLFGVASDYGPAAILATVALAAPNVVATRLERRGRDDVAQLVRGLLAAGLGGALLGLTGRATGLAGLVLAVAAWLTLDAVQLFRHGPPAERDEVQADEPPPGVPRGRHRLRQRIVAVPRRLARPLLVELEGGDAAEGQVRTDDSHASRDRDREPVDERA